MNKIDIFSLLCAISLGGCIAPDPPPFPPDSAADPQAHSASKPPQFSGIDETTEQIKVALRASEEEAKSAQEMPGMQHGEMQHGSAPSSEKKALVEQMKKTSQEMKATSDAMKKKSGDPTGQAVYACPMHPQIQSDQPGKCPLCEMTLVKKKDDQ